MQEIQLTQNKVTLVDDEDYEFLNQFKWYAHRNKGRNTFYARRNVNVNKKRIIIHMHRCILQLSDSKLLCDHIDLNGLNNTKANLRISDYSQNGANRKTASKPDSIYLGVYKNGNKWVAKTRKNGKLYSVYGLSSEKEAAIEYNNLAIKHHGAFSRLNKISF